METRASSRQLQSSYYPERRSGKDRRARPTSPFSWASLRGARGRARRSEDRERHRFVDVYSPIFLLVVLTILVLSVADALLTLNLLSHGAQELNPVMDFFIQYGTLTFLLVKYLLTASGVVVLLILKNCSFLGGRISAQTLLVAIPFLYGFLIAYEVVLVLSIPA